MTLLEIPMSEPKAGDRVVLQVGERRFHTTAGTLTERSEYFKSYFSGQWRIEKQEDGSIFIDSDGDAFDYLLRYLRRGTFPLAFDIVKGHDYALYSRILEEAKYFQCPLLVTWLEDKCYDECISSHVSTELQNSDRPSSFESSVLNDLKLIPCSKSEKKIYVCPRGIKPHLGAPENCGRQCRNARGDSGPVYETEKGISKWLVAITKYQLNYGWMTDFGDAFRTYLGAKEVLQQLGT